MPLDGLTLHFLKTELLQSIRGCRIEKIHQPARDVLVLHLRSRQGASRLLLSASANSPRLHLTAYAPDNPAVPPMLCMLLCKHLTGAVITDLRQHGLDRTIFLDLAGTNELGDATKFTLCAEIMAKHSNLILCAADGTIVDAVKRVDLTQSSVRQILPGLPYQLPPAQNKLDLRETDADSLIDAVCALPGKRLSAALLDTLEGVSPLIARELAAKVCGGDCGVAELTAQQKAALKRQLTALQATVAENSAAPTMLLRDGLPFDFSFADVTQYGFAVQARPCESFSALLDDFYYEKDRVERTRQRSQSMQKLLQSATARAARKLQSREAELAACADKDRLRVNAELILANQYALQKGAPFYDLINYYEDNRPIRVPADPALSPAANAQKYFKEYRKAKTAEQLLGTLIEESRQELSYLESVADAVSRADGFAELAEIRAEL
ncbi:MAG: NFACT family protein, partial [Clostridia bacterium]|nr:NFACT family protein [Clostridia bacterium]